MRLAHRSWLYILICISTCDVPLAFAYRHHSRHPKAASTERTTEEEARIAAPLADEVCFAPDEPCDLKLVKFVRAAQQSLDIAIFDINLDSLVHEILVQSKRIPVRIVVDRREAKSTHSLVPLLLKAGANVRYGRQRGIMHNKFAIIDARLLVTGSFNHTRGAAFKNSENQVYLGSPQVVSRYRQRFEKLWREAATD